MPSLTQPFGQRQNVAVRELPSVSIVVPNWNGAAHLPDCLGSLHALDYPEDLFEVILVDNGSTDESRALVEERFPTVRLIELRRNEGFAKACNAGVDAARSECVAFMNNDMRADRTWLRGLVESYEPSEGYVCVGGVILSWDGSCLDFVEGTINFHAFGWQEHFRKPLDEELIVDGRDLLFPSGGSMLISRDLYLDLGGFDSDYFAYYEDVDLGWRLWLAGYKVRLAGSARVFHHHHGSAAALPSHLPSFLYERNALFTLFKNLSDENLSRILAPTLLLAIERAVIAGGLANEFPDVRDRSFDEAEPMAAPALIPLYAVSDVLDQLPELIERRRQVQSRRRRDDDEIFELFFRPFTPWMHDERYLRASIALRELFGLDRLFPRQRATHVLVVADDMRLEDLTGHLQANVVAIWPRDTGETLEDLLKESDLVIAGAATSQGDVIAAHVRGLLVVYAAEGDTVRNSRLTARADVVIGNGPKALPVERLNAIVREPWRWRRAGGGIEGIPVPEDLQELLRVQRELVHADPSNHSSRPVSGRAVLRPAQTVGRFLRRLALWA